MLELTALQETSNRFSELSDKMSILYWTIQKEQRWLDRLAAVK
jgi:hypothetical protein